MKNNFVFKPWCVSPYGLMSPCVAARVAVRRAHAPYLAGMESLEAGEVGWGLEGAENIGHEGERGEGGLGHAALTELCKQDTHTHKRTHAHTHTHKRTHARAHTHKRTHTHTHMEWIHN